MSHELTPADDKPKDPVLSNKLYDFLKFLAQVLLPAAGTAYAGIAALWGWGAVTQVVGTIVAVDTFLGVVLAFLTQQYNNSEAPYDGTAHVVTDPNSGLVQTTMILKNYENPAEVVQQDSMRFKVTNQPPPAQPNGF